MTGRYRPKAEFLQLIADDTIDVEHGAEAGAHLQRLLSFLDDEDDTNRDWATFLLAQTEINTAEVCAALESTARDQNDAVRNEALNGLAKRAPETALPLVRNALLGSSATLPLFEAAERLADANLAGILKERWLSDSGDQQLDEAARTAFAACSTESEA